MFIIIKFISQHRSIFSSLALSVTADASDISSIKNAFNTIRTKLGSDPEVLLYNASGFQFGKLHFSFSKNRVFIFFIKVIFWI
jgi:hypothetical protein